MKAIVQERFGPPEEVLRLREIDRPAVDSGEVLAQGRLFGSIPRMLGLMARSRFERHLPRSGGEPPPTKKEAMATLADLLTEGKLTPVIDRTYPLEEVPEAMAYLQTGRACGRIVITV